ncbi:MAG: 50S ribosomal protein L4 [Ignavibacteriaceae bacterium]|jgi:LSU ribosomal protein L4P|nr:MAG: 50S ribosomal protein L4 [Chlorobiota bacterium]KXK05750.1 MAG: 50S ribosomal protein L4 [Chlorobi bacterium OLB4]MBV6398418.1 50S ribosomal protein L4 [Ignavibacteria bacterium]MCC6885990.1 50S ribosomal protein L4 [Ignavibacteriales bacterium]MCE7952760.1 50S ribosomal protein L4 [Chlorobi bacterium CHB7]MDL1886870.1 50S ribosomal protein L4 [Ignavibacteria bacterium CHB1]MEB2330220.1 50S ribosomal protein L4 [Ignavibacteriaceae bacterium]OQY77901.1 MAG: 50S ribosomal protein L4 [I
MELKVYKIDGTESSETVNLPDEIFNIEPNNHLIYQAVRVFLTNQRQGTSKAKERSEVKGGGKKPFRQKGTGRARQGTSRSPLMAGGGTIFGPKPRYYRLSLPKKAARLARKSALSIKAKENQIKVVEDFKFENPKTKDLHSILKALKLETTKTLLLLPENNSSLYKSGRNLPKCDVKISDKVATYDLLNNKMILLQKSAVENLCKSLLA